MTSVSETTRTLRYELRSREIYIEEPITSPELLSEHPQTQEESIRSIQETPNSQFRLVLSVTPCVPRISSLESVNDNTSPLLFSSTSSLIFVPTPDSPKDQPPPSPTSSTSSLTSFHSCNTSSQHNTLSPELFSPTPTSQNKWPSPPPLPQRSPRIRRRHNLHNYASLASTNRSQEKRNSVGAPPLDYLTSPPYVTTVEMSCLQHWAIPGYPPWMIFLVLVLRHRSCKRHNYSASLNFTYQHIHREVADGDHKASWLWTS